MNAPNQFTSRCAAADDRDKVPPGTWHGHDVGRGPGPAPSGAGDENEVPAGTWHGWLTAAGRR
jgi:hypothetical protein